MLSPQKIAVVIPCLNEAAAISTVVMEVRKLIPTVFVVDDGSTDATSERARAVGAVVLRHDVSQGKGLALMKGWRHAAEQGFDWALCMDGDGQHAPTDICRFLCCEGADLVIGNRMSDCSAMPPLRRFVNRWMSSRISQLAGQPLPDTQCGFRLMNLNAWSTLSIDASHFEIESEVLFSFLAAGLRVKFVPIEVIYKDEQSKIHPLRDTIRWFKWWNRAQHRLKNLRPKAAEFQQR